MYETKLDTEWKAEGGALTAVRFGGSYTSRHRVNESAGTFGVNCFYCRYPTSADPALFSTFNLGKVGSGGNLPAGFLRYDPNAYLEFLASPAALLSRDLALGLAPGTSAAQFAEDSDGNGFAAVRNPGDFVKERVYSGYIEADF